VESERAFDDRWRPRSAAADVTASRQGRHYLTTSRAGVLLVHVPHCFLFSLVPWVLSLDLRFHVDSYLGLAYSRHFLWTDSLFACTIGIPAIIYFFEYQSAQMMHNALLTPHGEEMAQFSQKSVMGTIFETTQRLAYHSL
jgi:hypothetical protein